MTDNITTEERLTAQKHQAILIRCVSLGTHTGEYEGKPWSRAQLYLEYELPQVKRRTGAPFTVGRIFTHSMYEKSQLRQSLKEWIGEEKLQSGDFFLKDLLGQPAELEITSFKQGDKTKFSIGKIFPAKGEQTSRRTHNDPVYFEMDSVFDEFTYSMLPSWMKEKIAASPEYKRFHKS